MISDDIEKVKEQLILIAQERDWQIILTRKDTNTLITFLDSLQIKIEELEQSPEPIDLSEFLSAGENETGGNVIPFPSLNKRKGGVL